MPGGAAGAEEDAVDVAEFFGAYVESAEVSGAIVVGEASAHGVEEGGGLLEDFFFHEVVKVAQFGVFFLPVDGFYYGVDGLVVGSGYIKVIVFDVNDFAVFEVDDAFGAHGDGGDVASEEELVVPYADEEWRAFASTDDFSGVVFADDGDAVGAFYLGQAHADAFKEAFFA